MGSVCVMHMLPRLFGPGAAWPRQLNEFSIFARPPLGGASTHPRPDESIPSNGPFRAGPVICLGRAGDACVVGALERVGDTLYGANLAAVLRTLMPPASAALREVNRPSKRAEK